MRVVRGRVYCCRNSYHLVWSSGMLSFERKPGSSLLIVGSDSLYAEGLASSSYGEQNFLVAGCGISLTRMHASRLFWEYERPALLKAGAMYLLNCVECVCFYQDKLMCCGHVLQMLTKRTPGNSAAARRAISCTHAGTYPFLTGLRMESSGANSGGLQCGAGKPACTHCSDQAPRADGDPSKEYAERQR